MKKVLIFSLLIVFIAFFGTASDAENKLKVKSITIIFENGATGAINEITINEEESVAGSPVPGPKKVKKLNKIENNLNEFKVNVNGQNQDNGRYEEVSGGRLEYEYRLFFKPRGYKGPDPNCVEDPVTHKLWCW